MASGNGVAQARVKGPKTLAGAPGFEPGNGGIKIRCLTTWLRPNGPVVAKPCFAWTRGGPQLYSEGQLAAILAAFAHGSLRLPPGALAAITPARRMPSHGTLMTRIMGCIAALSLRTDGRAERSAAW